MILVDTAKFTIGRHRPNWYNSCEPKIPVYDEFKVKTLVECHTLPSLRFKFIENYECSQKVISDIHLSFFSGHSALMMFSATFTCILAIQRLKNSLQSTLSKSIISLIIIFEIDLAIFVALTRVSDYRHHPSDVVIGLLVGFLVAIFIKTFLDRTKCKVEDELEDRPITTIHNVQLTTKERSLAEIV